MKIGVLLVTSMLFGLAAAAQSNLFVPFGLSEDEVKTFLAGKDYIRQILEENDMNRVRAVLDENKQVEYVFENGALYATTVTRFYRDRRVAKEVEQNCLGYMHQVSRGALKETNENGVICHTAVTEGRAVKLFIQHHDSGVTLTLTSISRTLGPIPPEEQHYYYEVELLQRRFISN